ncbi:transcriptional regulator [uncultured Veillonella sp.]|uniref:type IV toxin-antitoxin system AbiEi family antitoxin domain-containing protein n=1 Tax=uncultured Veillonella sp. TaxID=159268 RepID=UPI0028DCA5B9|nr:transcriptional regulator [uncultured Veillonella sp.]
MDILDIKKSLIYDAFEDNDGLLNFNQVKELGLSYYTLNLMLANKEVSSDEHGLYSLPDVYIDEWFAIQHRFPKGIFSLDSALWLHGLSLTVPFQFTLSFPYGTNTKNLKQNNILPIVLRSYYDIGVDRLERQPNQIISVYSKERTLVECLRPIYKMDIQLISSAFQMYFKENKYNLDELYYYGKLFKVTSKLQSYIEVLT